MDYTLPYSYSIVVMDSKRIVSKNIGIHIYTHTHIDAYKGIHRNRNKVGGDPMTSH